MTDKKKEILNIINSRQNEYVEDLQRRIRDKISRHSEFKEINFGSDTGTRQKHNDKTLNRTLT